MPRLLADLADVTGLSQAMSEALAPLRRHPDMTALLHNVAVVHSTL